MNNARKREAKDTTMVTGQGIQIEVTVNVEQIWHFKAFREHISGIILIKCRSIAKKIIFVSVISDQEIWSEQGEIDKVVEVQC